MDASANRCVEGLRVVEDGIRFVLDAADITAELRALRHLVRETTAALPGGADRLLRARNSAGDVARNAPSAAHAGVCDIVCANLKRAQEAVRSLEEFSRAVQPQASARYGEARFRLYDIEKRINELLNAARRHAIPDAPFLYAVADYETLSSGGTFAYLSALLKARVPVIQLREKNASDKTLVEQAEAVRRNMQDSDALLFINDRVDIALAAGAHGVHLGQDDISAEAAREIAGDRLLIGISTHSMKEANKARLFCPDYLSVGAVFASPTKPERTPVGATLITAVARKFGIPVVAIGGINADNAAQVAAAGAAGAAVISDLARAADPCAQAEKITAILKSNYRKPAKPGEDAHA
jgi:thiamine-phosphate pyrophosphorylase